MKYLLELALHKKLSSEMDIIALNLRDLSLSHSRKMDLLTRLEGDKKPPRYDLQSTFPLKKCIDREKGYLSQNTPGLSRTHIIFQKNL